VDVVDIFRKEQRCVVIGLIDFVFVSIIERMVLGQNPDTGKDDC